MIVLTIALCIMTLGYAALQEKIDITGGASVHALLSENKDNPYFIKDYNEY